MRTFAALLLALCLAVPSAAFAAPSNGGGKVGSAGSFGIGLAGGAPTSLTGKYFLDDRLALDFGLDFSYGYGGSWRHGWGNGFGLHGDALWHVAQLASNADLSIPLYIGAGLQLATWSSYSYKGDYYGSGAAVAARVPFGIGLWLKRVPLEFFTEVGPEIWMAPVIGADLFGSIGFRFYF